MKHFTKLFVAIAVFMVAAVANAQEQVHATFASPSNTNAVWHSDTRSFTWTQSYYNQVRNIGLPSGNISNYKKLVIDYEFISGDRFRILFYQGGSNIAAFVNQNGAYWDDAFTKQVAATSNGVVEIPIYEFLSQASGYSTDFILNATEICLSGLGNSGEVKINDIYVETYAPGDEKPSIVAEEEEQKPDKPEGNYVDLTEAFPSLNPALEKKLGNGELVVGARNQDVIANLSEYTNLTIVTSPNLKLVLYMNHEVAAQQNAADYAEGDAGKYVFMDVQADENGIINVDLTQFEKRELNCICLPWDNSNKGTVWYILLTEDAPIFDFNAMDVATSDNDGSTAGDITSSVSLRKGGVTMTISAAAEGATTPNRYWSTAKGPQLRMYSGHIVMDAPEGKAITKVEVDNGRWNNNNAINGEAGYVWEGNSTNIVIDIAGNSQMNKITVTLADKNDETTTYEGLPTSINTTKAVAEKSEIFNIAGQKLVAPMKGINIIGGKKVLVK